MIYSSYMSVITGMSVEVLIYLPLSGTHDHMNVTHNAKTEVIAIKEYKFCRKLSHMSCTLLHGSFIKKSGAVCSHYYAISHTAPDSKYCSQSLV